MMSTFIFLCVMHYQYAGQIFHQPPCVSDDIGWVDHSHNFYFAPGIQPKKQDFLADKLSHALPGIHIHPATLKDSKNGTTHTAK